MKVVPWLGVLWAVRVPLWDWAIQAAMARLPRPLPPGVLRVWEWSAR
ncbi:MAG: hypothetical protein U0232_20705 [Thermomicrobiales bacterium]